VSKKYKNNLCDPCKKDKKMSRKYSWLKLEIFLFTWDSNFFFFPGNLYRIIEVWIVMRKIYEFFNILKYVFKQWVHIHTGAKWVAGHPIC
jgi:hypothetical protein